MVGVDEDVADAVADRPVGADCAHQQAREGQEELGGVALLIAPGQGASVLVDVGQGDLAAQPAGADAFEESQEVLARRAGPLVDGQGDDLVDEVGGVVRWVNEPGVGEGDESRRQVGAEQCGGEGAPGAAGVAIVERLGREERLLPHDAGEHGRADDRQAALVLLDDGIHAAGDAGSGGDAPVRVEGDRQGEGGRG